MTALFEREQLGTALSALAAAAGLEPATSAAPVPPARVRTRDDRGRWLVAAAGALGIDADLLPLRYGELPRRLPALGPVLLVAGDGRALAVLASGQRFDVLRPDLGRTTLDRAELRSLVAGEKEAEATAELAPVLGALPAKAAARARTALLEARLEDEHVCDAYALRPAPHRPFSAALRRMGVVAAAALLSLCLVGERLLWVLAFALFGRAALSGRMEPAWIVGFLLALVSSLPLRFASVSLQGAIAAGVGALLKRRLLAGALRLGPDDVRSEGAGSALGRVVESEAVEGLALQGGFSLAVAAVELVLSFLVLLGGAGGLGHAALLVGFVAATAGLARVLHGRMRAFAAARIELSRDLVERMVGHRTRLAQAGPLRWHEGEDERLASYLGASRRVDRVVVWLGGALPRAWLVLGLVPLASAVVGGAPADAIAIGLGGLLLAQGALDRLREGVSAVTSCRVAFSAVRPLFEAARRVEPAPPPELALPEPSQHAVALDAERLVFRYRAGGPPIIQGATLRVEAGDRVLLEGPSGGGKSTLAALLSGLRLPESGLLLSGGLDRRTLGETGWRARVASAPQFHENHILCETLAFNLLLSRGWPAGPDEIAEAETLCRELGLGELLERMPSGIMQVVGDTGWQLSHGEKSRVYLARALLSGAEVVVLDESFGALDPETLLRCLECARRRARALVVIAHP